MGVFLEWLIEQRSAVAITGAIVLFAVTLILRYGFELWWPFGIVMSVALGLAGVVAAGRE